MTLKVSWPQALAWRLHRQLLDPVTRQSVPDVVRRLCGVQAQGDSSGRGSARWANDWSRSRWMGTQP